MPEKARENSPVLMMHRPALSLVMWRGQFSLFEVFLQLLSKVRAISGQLPRKMTVR